MVLRKQWYYANNDTTQTMVNKSKSCWPITVTATSERMALFKGSKTRVWVFRTFPVVGSGCDGGCCRPTCTLKKKLVNGLQQNEHTVPERFELQDILSVCGVQPHHAWKKQYLKEIDNPKHRSIVKKTLIQELFMDTALAISNKWWYSPLTASHSYVYEKKIEMASKPTSFLSFDCEAVKELSSG